MTEMDLYFLKYFEKKQIKRTANRIGGAFIIGIVATTAMLFALGDFPTRVLGLDANLANWLEQILYSALYFTVPFIIMTVPLNTRVSVLCSFSRPKKGYTFPLLLVGFGVSMLANILTEPVIAFFESFGITDPGVSLETGLKRGWIYPLLSVIGGALLPALVEEFALRGIVLGAFRKFGNGFAIVASALLFGIMHGTISQIPFAFMLGLYLGYMTVKTSSIWPAVILHFLNNAFSFLLDSFSDIIGSAAMVYVNYLYFIVMMLLFFVGIMLLKDKDISIKPGNTGFSSTARKIGWAASTPTVIILVVYIVLQIAILQKL